MRFGDIEIADFRFGDIQPVKLCMGDVEVWSASGSSSGSGVDCNDWMLLGYDSYGDCRCQNYGKDCTCCSGSIVTWYESDDTMHEDSYGNGIIPNNRYANNPDIVAVEICGGITAIGTSNRSYVFAGCSNLSSVCISYGVEYIGGRAFEGLYNLKSVTIPSSVTGIGENAFYNFDSSCTITFEGPCPTLPGFYGDKDCFGKYTNIIVPDQYLGDYCYAMKDGENALRVNIESDQGNTCSVFCDDWENEGYESYEDCTCQKFSENCPDPCVEWEDEGWSSYEECTCVKLGTNCGD